MKAFVLLALLSMSTVSFAASTLEASTGRELKALESVVAAKTTYSAEAGVEARVVSLKRDHALNNIIRMALVLSAGSNDRQVFLIDENISSVDSVRFVNAETVVIDYTIETFEDEEEMNPIPAEKTITVKILKNESDASLQNKIVIL